MLCSLQSCTSLSGAGIVVRVVLLAELSGAPSVRSALAFHRSPLPVFTASQQQHCGTMLLLALFESGYCKHVQLHNPRFPLLPVKGTQGNNAIPKRAGRTNVVQLQHDLCKY